MRGANRRSRLRLVALGLALSGAAATRPVALAQEPSGAAYDRHGDLVAIWEVDPPDAAACRELLIPWVFGDDFEIGSTCAWSDRVGLTESCAVCGDAFVAVAEGEACDDGNFDDTDGCTFCQYASCGDGFVWSGVEQCDPAADPVNCLPGCVLSACGDGIVFAPAGEACDDGNQESETQCPYGTPVCTGCDATCGAELQLVGAYCGDFQQDPREECDDGNTVTEAECGYGEGACEVCGANCTAVPRTGPFCGDGAVDSPHEDCDDRNSLACGTCSADCRDPQPALAATGLLVLPAGAALADGETFSLQDGAGNGLTFEFDRLGDGAQPGNVGIVVTGSPSETVVRNNCVLAINGVFGLGMSASAIGSQAIALVQDFASAMGNAAITDTVGSASFLGFGMSGGQAANCPIGINCLSDADCASGFCDGMECGAP